MFKEDFFERDNAFGAEKWELFEEAGAAAAFRTRVALMNEFSTAWDMKG